MRDQRGAIVVEATVALSTFIFAIFTILSIVNICFVQAKIGVALNTAAKEISQYSYLYYAFGVDGLDAKFSEGTEESKQLATDTIDGIGTFMDSLSGASNSAQSGDFDGMIRDIQNGADNVDSLITQYAEQLKSDPKGFVLGMGKMATNELKEKGKAVLAQILAKIFMEKNLISGPDDDPNSFLERYHVVDGMDGLDFNYTTFLFGGKSNEIQLVVTYDIQVIELLNLDFKFTIRQCSKTSAWGNGISALEPAQGSGAASTSQNLWDLPPAERGKEIVAAEKEEYSYTDSGHGFDAYNNDGGKNEFVTILSIDTNADSYKNASAIESKLKQAYQNMDNRVSSMDEEIQMKNEDGETVSVTSDPESRTYRVVLVVPDNADLSVVAEAVKAFKEAYPGVEVSVRQGYGSPPETDEGGK